MARVVVLVLALASLAAPAAADDGFVWEAPATCPDARDVRARIERRLGAGASVHGIEVAIARETNGFVARIASPTSGGARSNAAGVAKSIDTGGVTVANQVRTLTSARCDELADAVAVIVARLATEAARIRVAAAAEEAPRREPPPAVVVERSPRLPVGTWGGGARLLAVSGVGTLPGIAIGGDVAGFVRRRDYFVEAGLARWASSPLYLVKGAPGRVEVTLDSAALRGGWSPQRMPIRAWLGLELGTLTGRGVELDNPQVGSARWIAGTGGFGVAWPMARLVRLVGTFDVVVPLQQMSFILADGQQIYRPSPAAARCALGLELGWR